MWLLYLWLHEMVAIDVQETQTRGLLFYAPRGVLLLGQLRPPCPRQIGRLMTGPNVLPKSEKFPSSTRE